MFAVDDSPYFPDLEQLVTHFSSHSSLASFRLTHPVAPILREPLRIEIGGGGHRGESDQFNFSNAVLIGPDELTLGTWYNNKNNLIHLIILVIISAIAGILLKSHLINFF